MPSRKLVFDLDHGEIYEWGAQLGTLLAFPEGDPPEGQMFSCFLSLAAPNTSRLVLSQAFSGGTSPPFTSATNVTPSPARSAGLSSICRRHVNSILAFRSCRRATIDTDAPGAKVSATIRRFSSADQSRRGRRSPPAPACPASSATNTNDHVHYDFVDTMIVSLRYLDGPAINQCRPGGLRRRNT